MAYEQKDDSFSLFKNDRKEKDTHPDYTGNGMVGGRSVWVNAWLKQDKNGKTYMSCNVKPKDGQRAEANDRPMADVIDDSIPF